MFARIAISAFGSPRLPEAQENQGESFISVTETGPLEQAYMQSATFRAAADNSKVTSSYWHIALTNGLG